MYCYLAIGELEKSSLANIASSKLIKIAGKDLVIKRCSKSDSFSTIFESALMKCGIDISIQSKIFQVAFHKGYWVSREYRVQWIYG